MLNKLLFLLASTTSGETETPYSRFKVRPTLEDGLVGYINMLGEEAGYFELLEGKSIVYETSDYTMGMIVSDYQGFPVYMTLDYPSDEPKLCKLVNQTTGYEAYGVVQNNNAIIMFATKAEADAYLSGGSSTPTVDPMWLESDVGKTVTIAVYLIEPPEVQYTLGEQVGTFSIKVGQKDFTDSSTGEVTTYLGYSTNLGHGAGVNGVGRYTYGTLIDGGNFGFVGFALNQNENTVTIAINNPYNENLFSNGYIGLEVNGSVYLKGFGINTTLGETMFYKCSLHEGSELTLTKNDTIAVKVYTVEVS